MIKQFDAWFTITADVRPPIMPVVNGMYLFFGARERVFKRLNELVTLVDKYQLTAASINSFSPRSLSPLRESVLCVATTEENQEKTKKVMIHELGIEPQLWKSLEQAEADAAKDGWLWLAGRITELAQALKQPFAVSRKELERDLKMTGFKLLTMYEDGGEDLVTEMRLGGMEAFLEEVRDLVLGDWKGQTSEGELVTSPNLVEHLIPHWDMSSNQMA